MEAGPSARACERIPGVAFFFLCACKSENKKNRANGRIEGGRRAKVLKRVLCFWFEATKWTCNAIRICHTERDEWSIEQCCHKCLPSRRRGWKGALRSWTEFGRPADRPRAWREIPEAAGNVQEYYAWWKCQKRTISNYVQSFVKNNIGIGPRKDPWGFQQYNCTLSSLIALKAF